MAKRNNAAGPAVQTSGLIRLRPHVLIGIAVMLGAGYCGYLAWQTHVPAVRQHPSYRITADRIHITTPPPWIRSDIRREVLRDLEPLAEQSLLDGGAPLARLKEAFEYHPWVASVERVSKQLPTGIQIDLTYRKPTTAIEVVGQQGTELLVADATSVRLPEADLTEVERRYLPRITGIAEVPPVGQRWTDPRIVSGIRLAMGLGDAWGELRLVEIVPRPDDGLSTDPTATCFHILSSGGTRIVWGAAPGEEPAQESPFAAKLERLQSYAKQFGNLDTIWGPEEIDVRNDLHVQRRADRRKPTEKLTAGDAAHPSADGGDVADPVEADEEIATRNEEAEVAR
jgi:hypothetical protein